MSCGYKREPLVQNLPRDNPDFNGPLSLHKKKTEKHTNIKENFCGSEIDQYGEERSAKDMQMLKEFGCRK